MISAERSTLGQGLCPLHSNAPKPDLSAGLWMILRSSASISL